jgi:hypothetical protein
MAHRRIAAIMLVFLGASAIASLMLSCSPPEKQSLPETAQEARVIVVSLRGYVGCGVDAEILRQPLAEAVADLNEPVDVVVFRFDSGGGMLNRVGPLSDMIHGYFNEREIECIGWIDRAESASSIVALTIPDLWMPPEGVIGAAVGVRETGPDIWETLPPQQQEAIRFMVAAAASRGGHDREVALSITLPDPSSSGTTHGARVLTGVKASSEGLARNADSLEDALNAIYGSDGWQIDLQRSERIGRDVERAEAARVQLTDLYQRLDGAIEASRGGNADAYEQADALLGELLALATVDDPAVQRAIEFLGGFQRVTRAIDRVEALSDETEP